MRNAGDMDSTEIADEGNLTVNVYAATEIISLCNVTIERYVDQLPQQSPPDTARSTLSRYIFYFCLILICCIGTCSTCMCMCIQIEYFSVVTGTGELDTSEEAAGADPDAPSTCPYLLLDVRDKDDYDKCHIISGENFSVLHVLSCIISNSKLGVIQPRCCRGHATTLLKTFWSMYPLVFNFGHHSSIEICSLNSWYVRKTKQAELLSCMMKTRELHLRQQLCLFSVGLTMHLCCLAV